MFVCACAPPGGGRNFVTPRLWRSFNMIWMPELNKNTLKQIYTEILLGTYLIKGFLKKNPQEQLLDRVVPLVESSIRLFQTLKSMLLPTPSKSHYTFNSRDLAKVFQGIMQVIATTVY